MIPSDVTDRKAASILPSSMRATGLGETQGQREATEGVPWVETNKHPEICGVEGRGEDVTFPLCSSQVAAQQQESASTQKAEREVSRMVMVMVGSFCLCYVPYAALAMYMVNNRSHGLDLRLVTIPAFFSKSACVYNPIIYCFMNKQVKFPFPLL